MNSGIGCDIVDIARIKKVCLRQPKFCETVLSESEQPVYAVRCEASEERGYRYLASRWAAKEAFSKALGTGFRGAVNFSDISILNNELGAPYVQLSGKLAVQIKNQRLKCHVSISDTDSSAMAMVVIEKE